MVQSPCWDDAQSMWEVAGIPKPKVLGRRGASPTPATMVLPPMAPLPDGESPNHRMQVVSGRIFPHMWGSLL